MGRDYSRLALILTKVTAGTITIPLPNISNCEYDNNYTFNNYVKFGVPPRDLAVPDEQRVALTSFDINY